MAHGKPLSTNAAALIDGLGRAFPWFAVDPAALGWHALGFVFLASPANHLIRCLMGKSPDLLAYAVRRRRRAAGALFGPPTSRAASPSEAAVEAAATGDVSSEAASKAPAGDPRAGYVAAEPGPDESATLRAGRTIGTLERWIMLSLMLVGQYGLIGLVLTAKSIARFKKIEQDPEFAEYYLLGTLYSTLIALVCGMVLANV